MDAITLRDFIMICLGLLLGIAFHVPKEIHRARQLRDETKKWDERQEALRKQTNTPEDGQ